jgi:hypothetical protein
MGRQISFFINESDLSIFGEYIKNQQGIFILRTSPINKVLIVNEVLDIPYMNGYITSNFYLERVSIKELKPNLYSVGDATSPVIEFDQGRFKDGLLRSARLLYQTGFFNANDEWEKFPDEFITWCEDIFKWVKKTYKPCPLSDFKGYRISKAVLESVQKGEIQLTKK